MTPASRAMSHPSRFSAKLSGERVPFADSRPASEYKRTIVERRSAAVSTMRGPEIMKEATLAADARPSNHRPAKSSRRERVIGRMRLLVLVDTTGTSTRVLQYISRILAGRPAVDIHLTLITPGLPPEFMETGGAEVRLRKEQIESDLQSAQRRWTDAAHEKAERVLGTAKANLQRAGVTAARISTCVSSPLDARTPVDEVLLLARDLGCGTVVVGHRAHKWFGRLRGGHLAEQLVRTAKGLTVWVVD
jgi:nucleotide-binding universal stress UspA family protein